MSLNLNQLAATLPFTRSVSVAEPSFSTLSPTQLIHRPTQVLVSTRFPGFKYFEAGLSASGGDDEALAAVLLSDVVFRLGRDSAVASHAEVYSSLMTVRAFLLDAQLVRSALSALLPRGNTTLTRGTYVLSEEQVERVVLGAIDSAASGVAASTAARAVFARLIVRALAQIGLVSSGQPEYHAAGADSVAISLDELRALYVMESIKPVLSGALISAKLRDVDLGKKSAPGVVVQRIADALAAMGTSITQVLTALVEFDTACYLTQVSYYDLAQLPLTLRDSPDLSTLRNIANFALLAKAAPLPKPDMGPFEYASALRRVTTVVPSLAAVSLTQLSDFAALFLSARVLDHRGVLVGSVTALPMAQAPQLAVVQATDVTELVHSLEVVPPTISPAPVVASLLAKGLISVQTTRSIVAQLADALTLSETAVSLTLGLRDIDVEMLALARASTISRGVSEGATLFIYGVPAEGAIGQEVAAALGSTVYLTTPDEVIVMTTSADDVALKPLAQRLNGLPKKSGTSRMVKIGQRLVREFQKPYEYQLELPAGRRASLDGEPATEPTTLRALVRMTGALPDLTTSTSFLSVYREPALVEEATRNLGLMVALMASDAQAIRFRAIALLATHMRDACNEPTILNLAERALHSAVQESKVDLRTLSPYTTRVFFQSVVLSYVACLVRFGVVEQDAGTALLDVSRLYNELSLAIGQDLPIPRSIITAAAGSA